MEFKTDYRHALDRESERGHIVDPSQLSIPAHPGKDQLEGLKSRIRMGAKNVELGFFGAGKGSKDRGNTTPGMYGKDERAAMKELAKVNKINTTVHASAGVHGFSGFTGQKFDKQDRERNIHEVERAIDFAADTTEGGAVVMHLGDFPRPISEIEKEGKFEYYPGEKKEATMYLVDSQTGDMVQSISKSKSVHVPVFENGVMQTKKDAQGMLVPKTDERKFEFYEEKAKTARDAGETDYKKTNPAYLMFDDENKERLGDAKAWVTRHTREYDQGRQELERIQSEIKLIESGTNEYEKDRIDQLKQQEEAKMHQMEVAKNYAASHTQTYEKTKDMLERIQPLEEFGKQRTFEAVAELGKFAMDKTKEKKLAKPLFVAPENVLIEWGYGAHPDELKEVILKSREQFVQDNKEKLGERKAKELASTHIKATFDIGHANTWRKHFSGDDKGFKKWLLGKVDDLNKSGVIGHVHMSDNFGYEDEHGTLGEGTVPIKEFVAKMKKSGYKGTFLAEPAHNDYQALLGAWRSLESPIYKVDVSSRSWTDVEGGYFGRSFNPSYTIRSYLPIGGEKEPMTWAGVPLE